MNSGLDRCLSFINCQLQGVDGRSALGGLPRVRSAVTISRETGSGAHAIAEKLAEHLRTRPNARPWAVFDRNLVEKVLEEHSLPQRMARFMPEDRTSEMTGIMEELFDLHPPTWILVRQTAETILRLAQLGNVILIGRGGNVVTSKLKQVFHVRLVAPLDRRVEYVQKKAKGLTRKTALDVIRREDAGRRRYLKKYFDEDIDNPLLYHLVINTGFVTYDEAAGLIGDAVLGRWSAPPAAGSPEERAARM
jgi:cytidylate kinase